MKRFFAAFSACAALCSAVSFMLSPAYGQVLSGSLTGTFGQMTSTFDTARGGGVTGRIVQFGVRIVF